MKLQPNVFVIGFQKCGSSSLFDIICSHPKITGTHPKETFLLSDSEDENYSEERNMDLRTDNWSKYVSGGIDSRYIVEASVNNFYQNTALNYVRKLKNPKVIIIVRDPIERFISNFKYYKDRLLLQGFDVEINDYIKFVLSYDGDSDAIKNALLHGKYSEFINTWREEIGDNNVLLVAFKDLKTNRQKLFNALEEFLKLDASGFNFDGVTNKSVSAKYKWLHKLIHRLVGGKSFGLKGNLIKFYRQYFMSVQLYTLNKSNIAWLKKYYKTEYEHLHNYL